MILIQAWDFHAGGNFVLEMDRAARQSLRTIAILSNDYLAAKFTAAEWAAAFARDPTGTGGVLLPVRVGDYQPEGELPGMGTPLAPGASAAIVMPPRQIELWRVKRALRDIPATQAFRDYVASSGAEVRGSDGRVVAVENLSGLDQINVAISLTDNVSLQDFWRDGIYVYDSSSNFAAFAQILGLTPDAVDALVARANTFVV